MKRVGKPAFFIVAILIFALTYTAFFGISSMYGDRRDVYIKGAGDIRWGIDIRGGVEAVFVPDANDLNGREISDDEMDSAKTIINRRLIGKNITDSEVYVDYNAKQVIVRFPWQSGDTEFDPAQAIGELGAMAKLRFVDGTDFDPNNPYAHFNPSDPDDLKNKVLLEGADIKDAGVSYNSEKNQYEVGLEFSDEGSAKFAAATAKLQGKTISIWMDDDMLSAPTVQDTITGGHASISGSNMDQEYCKTLAGQIKSGALPFALRADDSQMNVISPTLGETSLNTMLLAGIIAFVLVCIFMVVCYRMSGFVACIALLGQVAGSIACVSGFFTFIPSFTMTLPGIAGIILSIGMGVDANVITSERIKEELREGKTLDGSINAGYDNGISAIIDGNVTVIIVALILMGAFGAPDGIMARIINPLMFMFKSSIMGSIYSFGFTLLIGIVFNFVMGVTASRLMLKGISKFKGLRDPRLYGGVK